MNTAIQHPGHTRVGAKVMPLILFLSKYNYNVKTSEFIEHVTLGSVQLYTVLLDLAMHGFAVYKMRPASTFATLCFVYLFFHVFFVGVFAVVFTIY